MKHFSLLENSVPVTKPVKNVNAERVDQLDILSALQAYEFRKPKKIIEDQGLLTRKPARNAEKSGPLPIPGADNVGVKGDHSERCMVICSNPVSADPLNFGHLQQNHLQQSFAATICSKNRTFAAKMHLSHK